MRLLKWLVPMFAGIALAVGPTPPAMAQVNWAQPDSASMDVPPNPAAIVTIPEFPQAGRQFAIQRSGPRGGPGNILKVANQNGRLEIWNGENMAFSFDLGRCFSFSRFDAQHNFGQSGNPMYATAPSDCRVWDGRRWNQTYRTQTSFYRNPCLYQPGYTAKVTGSPGGRIVETSGEGQGIVWDTQQTFPVKSIVKYDEGLGFFRMFNAGYIGQVDVLNEIK
jgi:hypothetical protein